MLAAAASPAGQYLNSSCRNDSHRHVDVPGLHGMRPEFRVHQLKLPERRKLWVRSADLHPVFRLCVWSPLESRRHLGHLCLQHDLAANGSGLLCGPNGGCLYRVRTAEGCAS